MNTRTKIFSALASAGILAAEWQLGTADSNTLVVGGETGQPADGASPTTSQPFPSNPNFSDDDEDHDRDDVDHIGDDEDHDRHDDDNPASASAPASSAPRFLAPTTTTSGQSATATGTFTGPTSSHPFGSVTVAVTLDNGRITALSEKVVSDGDRKSFSINNRAVPVLRQALIGTDGSTASTISGATYTTKAYLTSLQAALDSAR